FRNCRAHLVGQRKRGLTRYVMQLMNGARLAIGAQSVGIAQAAYTQALQYAKQRKQFGKAIIEFPPIFDMLTSMRVQIEAARSLLYDASMVVDIQHALDHFGEKNKETTAELKEVKRFAGLLTPMIKYYASEMCNRVAYDAIQIFGGAGYMRDHEVERLYRDARITTIYEGTSQLQIIGAVGGVTSGLFRRMLESKKNNSYPESFNSMIEKTDECERFLEQAITFVKEQNDHTCTEYHARALVDMAVETFMGILLLENARRSEDKLRVAKRFINYLEESPHIISAIPLFNGLPEDQLRDLTQIAVDRQFKKGQIIFSEGDEADGFYVIVQGLVKIFKLSVEGKEQILHIFESGEPFGEVPVFTGQHFPAHAEAIAKSRLFFFPRDAFTDLIEQNPSLALNMLGILSKRLRQFTVKVEHLSLKEVPGRLADYLLNLSDEKGGESPVDLKISKQQLASLLGTIPETLSRILTRMTKQGLIQVDGPRIKIMDREGLEELAMAGKPMS
ncbi:MAG: cyclic nucleotide-binding domain-containing protein, partial [Deltaproteobacteria bacterium]|nr:cyclic nucleotide-binding domain-containing protein [Deltaproteobacteria bacterium]